jgi:hypothetical protein
MGFASAGAPIGGTVFPIIARSLIPSVGCVRRLPGLCFAQSRFPHRFPWTMRIIGFILMLSLGLSNLVSLFALGSTEHAFIEGYTSIGAKATPPAL